MYFVVSDYYDSTSIETIAIDETNHLLSVVYKSNPLRVYDYEITDHTLTNTIVYGITSRLNEQKEYPTDTKSIGRYINHLRKNNFIELANSCSSI